MNWIWQNKVVQGIIFALVVFGVCIICGLTFHVEVGAKGNVVGIRLVEKAKK
jgi:hypothetical protein